MEKKLSNNIGLKVLSVFLAFFVWLAVMENRSIMNASSRTAIKIKNTVLK